MGIKFRVVPSLYRETHKKIAPEKLALGHAEGKARKAVVPENARWVLGSDTIVVAGKHVLGKPRNEREAMRMLGMLGKHPHTVMTAVALWDRAAGKISKACVKTRVWMRALTEEKMKTYIRHVNSYDKAGGYAIQSRPRIVKRIRGSYTNVMGLPKEKLRRMLKLRHSG
jgi:septum formation protein